MNALTNNASLTMTSREIAELTGKRHDNVTADIRKMLEALEITSPELSGIMEVPMPRGGSRPVEVFYLPKDLTITLVSGYNVQMRYAITKRWMELEAQVAKPVSLPTSFAEALRLAADLEEQKEQLAQANKQLTHERDGLSSVVGKHMHTVSRFARTLPGINSMKVKADLLDAGYLYKTRNTYRVYRKHSHLFVEKVNEMLGSVDIFVTEEGKCLLACMADMGELTKLKGAA